jgi:hypothetical protein
MLDSVAVKASLIVTFILFSGIALTVIPARASVGRQRVQAGKRQHDRLPHRDVDAARSNSGDKATGAALMLRIITLAIALLLDPAITAGAEMSGCGQLPDLSAAHLRWAAVRKSRVDPGHSEESCRSYGSNFFEAVTTRQAASFCRDGVDRQRSLELLDAEIEAFNDLIATQCSG